MENEWNFYSEIDFSNEAIQQYHIDTRDFHCITNENKPEKELQFQKIEKYQDRFFHTAEEVRNLLDRLFGESGGRKSWRFLMLESTDKRMDNWNMKYIRIHRTDKGLVVCDNTNYALSKEILNCKVNQECLHAH